METKLISPNGEIIKLPYYEILNYASLICEKFISLSEENKRKFDEFKKNYNFFSPYFDFMIIKLKYQLENPFFRKGVLLSKNNQIFFEDGETYGMTLYPNSDDISIGLNQDYNNFKVCLIDYDGNIFDVDKTKNLNHREYEEKILNELMISDKYICADYHRYINSKNYKTISVYMREHLGFVKIAVDDNIKLAIISNLVKEDIVSKIKKFPDIEVLETSISNEEKEQALNLINKTGKVK